MFSRLPPATLSFFFFNDTATTEIYTLSLHDALPIFISRKRQELLGPKLIRQSYALGALDKGVQAKLKELRQTGFVRRLWAKDPTLWHSDPVHQKIIRNALGWLYITEQQVHHLPRIKGVAESVRAAGFKHALLLGMGGSSLCPEVFRMTFGVVPGYPELHVLDSTVPAQVRSFEKRVDLAKTLCIVASKSGTTTEPDRKSTRLNSSHLVISYAV